MYLAFNLGGVETNANDSILAVRALRLWFFLKADSRTADLAAMAWEDAAAKFVQLNYKHHPDFHVSLTHGVL